MPHSGLISADFCTFQSRRSAISPSHQECDIRRNPAIGWVSRDFAKILTDRPSIRPAWFWAAFPRSGLISAAFAQPDTPLRNIALVPGMRPLAESGDRLEFSRFCENPNRSAVAPTSLILGHFPRSGLIFADFRTFQPRRSVISPSHQECDIRRSPAIGWISRKS